MKIYWKEKIKEYLLNSIMKNNSKKLFSILVWKPIVYFYWEKFSEEFMKKRVENNIFLKSLRLKKQNYDIEKHKKYSVYNKEVKHIESNIFDKNIFLYDNKILIIDMEKFELEYIEDKVIYEQYINKFNSLWKK